MKDSRRQGYMPLRKHGDLRNALYSALMDNRKIRGDSGAMRKPDIDIDNHKANEDFSE